MKDLYILIAAIVGASAAYITAKITSKNQLKIAQMNAEKDITMLNINQQNEMLKREVSLEREKLEKMHIILSEIALANSQTTSYFNSSSKNITIEEFRTNYLNNSLKLHTALAIADLYYPDMSQSIREINGDSNVFWGHQEQLMKTNIQENPQSFNSNLSEVSKACNEISKLVLNIQFKISLRGEKLKEELIKLNLHN